MNVSLDKLLANSSSFFSFSESLDDHSMNVLSGGVGELLQKLREFHGEALVFEVTDLCCSW